MFGSREIKAPVCARTTFSCRPLRSSLTQTTRCSHARQEIQSVHRTLKPSNSPLHLRAFAGGLPESDTYQPTVEPSQVIAEIHHTDGRQTHKFTYVHTRQQRHVCHITRDVIVLAAA